MSTCPSYIAFIPIITMNKIIVCLRAFAMFLPFTIMLQEGYTQSSAHFLFGIVTTTDQHSYAGPIRWGTEEVMWTDIFNSTKSGNDYLQYLQYLNNKVVVVTDAKGRDMFSIEVEDVFRQIHTYECQFGDIRSIQVISDSRIDLQMKNNFIYHLKNGSNDVGTTVRIFDIKEGLIKLPWDDIKRVEFVDSPAELSARFGEPLIGTVHTVLGEFTGQIEWDQDERLTTDLLNGEKDGEDMEIPFGSIRSIVKHLEGSQVILITGEEFILSGSNDVNSENRGVVVTVEGIGRISVQWDQFIKVTFDPSIRYEGPTYSDFPVAESLRGTVFTRTGQTLWGGIVYDLDEAFDTEFLQGKSMEIEYQIPFRNISSIMPLDDQSSQIQLISGERLTLGNMQDVSGSNDGILIIGDDSSLIKLGWDEVLEVRFK